jgi:MFS family permease
MFWSGAVPAIAYGVCSLVIPESPRYLVAQGRDAEAEGVLASIIGARARAKVEEIRNTVNREHKPRLTDLRGKWGLLPIVWIGMGLSVFQQFVGINVIFYYGSALWRISGFTEQNALMITMITGVTNIVTTLVAIAFIDKFGRKPLLLVGSLGMVVTLGITAWIFGTSPVDAEGFPVLSRESGLVALIAANGYVFCFGFSWGPVVWVLLGEMFNNMIRASALALSAAVQWVANFIVSTTFPPIAYNLGLGVSPTDSMRRLPPCRSFSSSPSSGRQRAKNWRRCDSRRACIEPAFDLGHSMCSRRGVRGCQWPHSSRCWASRRNMHRSPTRCCMQLSQPDRHHAALFQWG